MIRSPQKRMGNVRYVVMRNKDDVLGRWYPEKRNIYKDYKELFKDVRSGEPPGPVQAILIFINTHHTRTDAEGSNWEYLFFRQR